MKRKLIQISILCLVLTGTPIFAQELVQDAVVIEKAQVLEVKNQEERTIPGADIKSTFQTIVVEIIEGVNAGKIVTVENDYLKLEKGEVFYLRHITNALDKSETYSVADPDRMPTVYVFIGLFILSVLAFGGKQGARGLVALAASFVFIIYLLLPSVLNGFSPVLVSMGVSSLIIILGSYITHGFNRSTSSAVIGMVITIIFTGILAYASIHFGRLSGFATEEAVYLNLNTKGTIDFAGLLLGGMLIGLLGVLYDAAIGQAVTVDELRQVGPHLTRSIIFRRALRVGREHIGALVNTLAIAYVGASLPLLLLLYNSGVGTQVLVNQEIFATEILRAMVGSIGLIITVPITTLIAVLMLVKKPDISTVNPAIIEHEKESIKHHGHKH
ncbi:MAG: YibE/F family protein [bacterium]|nr:YibE/F family protein [bacterium]